jgi:hypothetical protein
LAQHSIIPDYIDIRDQDHLPDYLPPKQGLQAAEGFKVWHSRSNQPKVLLKLGRAGKITSSLKFVCDFGWLGKRAFPAYPLARQTKLVWQAFKTIYDSQ